MTVLARPATRSLLPGIAGGLLTGLALRFGLSALAVMSLAFLVLVPGRLVLTSTHRLSTHFNPSAALWVDAVMSDIQRGIVDVVRHRAETAERLAR